MVFGNETEAEAFAECNGLDKDASIEDIARAIASLPYHKDTKRTVIITQVCTRQSIGISKTDYGP